MSMSPVMFNQVKSYLEKTFENRSVSQCYFDLGGQTCFFKYFPYAGMFSKMSNFFLFFKASWFLWEFKLMVLFRVLWSAEKLAVETQCSYASKTDTQICQQNSHIPYNTSCFLQGSNKNLGSCSIFVRSLSVETVVVSWVVCRQPQKLTAEDLMLSC